MVIFDVSKLIAETRRIAADYKRATGKSLAVSSEIARHDACEFLNLKAVEPEAGEGFDAIGEASDWSGLKIQIKGRAIFDESKSGQRIGQLKFDKEWDAVVLVIMDEAFETQAIYMAGRKDVEKEVENLDTKRHNRGAMTVARFKHLAQLVWTPQTGIISA